METAHIINLIVINDGRETRRKKKDNGAMHCPSARAH